MTSYSRPFGSDSSTIAPEELSLRLISFASMRIRKTLKIGEPTQTEIGNEIGVGQSMIHKVLFRGKSFGRSRYDSYAEKIGMKLDDLTRALLTISRLEGYSLEARKLALTHHNPAKGVMELFRRCSDAISRDRSLATEDASRAFDYYKAYSEVLRFLSQAFDLDTERLQGAAVLIYEGDRNRAICLLGGENRSSERITRVLDNDPLLLWCLRMINRGREEHRLKAVVLQNVEELAQVKTQYGNITDSESITLEDSGGLLMFNQCEGSFVARIMKATQFDNPSSLTRVALLSFTDNLEKESGDEDSMNESLADEILACGASLASQIAAYGVEDRLECAELLMDARLESPGVSITRERLFDPCVFERAEHYGEQLLLAICETSEFHAQVATGDLWVYHATQKQYISPSDRYRHVSRKNRNMIIGDRTLEEVYDDEVAQHRLDPRPLGKTRYMTANRRALVINAKDNTARSSFWSSSHVLERGALVGLPLFFTPLRDSGGQFLAAIYIRFIVDLDEVAAKKVIRDICEEMKSNFGGVFNPLLGLRGANPQKMRLRLTKRDEEERGVWSEIYRVRNAATQSS